MPRKARILVSNYPHHIVQRGHNRKVVFLAELDFEHQKTNMDWSKLAVSARTVMALFPQLKDVRIVRTWAGIEAFMPDNLPVIGRSGTAENAYHAFGFSAHGFQLSPIVGKIISQLIIDDQTELPIEPFSIKRF